MIEDDIYRTSTQYRYWSFTPAQLSHLRQTTNDLASARVRHALARAHGPSSNTSIETLTVSEELAIIAWGCEKILEIGASIKPVEVPMDIRCTAIQYLRRFYLTNSPMTYHPKQILACALYLATKSCHWHVSIGRYVAEVDGVEEELVKGPEFLLMQGLRFTLEVRHAVKGLEGGQVEMNQLVKEKRLGGWSERRVNEAVKKARDILRGPAQMTDVYFLYTPSQIWLAALLVVDAELVHLYIEQKVGDSENILPIKDKLLSTITSCATILSSYTPPSDNPSHAKEMRRIGKKLHACQNPEKMDIVSALNEGKIKREGEDSERDDKKAKKRKLEKEMRDRDAEVFGPELRSLK
jgi:cyclin H